MLKKLHIEQFVIISELSLDFLPDLTILTGETGAGKSILLDATGLILGDKSNPESIRQGADQSVIEATFTLPGRHPVWTYISEQGLGDSSGELTIRRIIPRSGGDSITLNGRAIELAQLKKIGTFLTEIHGQFANQSLLDPANQLTLLDLSGAFPHEVFKNVADALADVNRYTAELEEENTFLSRNKKELPKIEDIVARFEKVGMRDGFIDDVKEHHATLLTAKETSAAFQGILSQLISTNGVVMALSNANTILGRNKNLDPVKTAKLSQLLSSALDNARGAVTEMGRLSPEYDIDTAPLARIEEVLTVLNTLAKEAKITFDDLPRYYGDMSVKLNRIRNGREQIAKLEEALHKAKRAYLHHAHILTEKRVEAAEALSKAITAEFAPLKLMRAEFHALVEEKATLPWTDLGINTVTFMARMNPGMPFSPVAETASGGELARLILALKVVVQRVQTIPTLIFDEVDTGIGGAAAAAVGERLAQLADTTQVLVITHSPQVAARGNQHLHVSKQTDGLTTTSVVKQLTLEERTDEISRMLAGDEITSESHAAAKKLIDEAQAAANVRRK